VELHFLRPTARCGKKISVIFFGCQHAPRADARVMNIKLNTWHLSLFTGVSVGASVFTITVMSIDRYLAIQHPIAFRKVFNRRSAIMVKKNWRGTVVILFIRSLLSSSQVKIRRSGK